MREKANEIGGEMKRTRIESTSAGCVRTQPRTAFRTLAPSLSSRAPCKTQTYRELYEEQTGGVPSPAVKSLVGIAKLRPEDEGKSDSEILTEALWEKYEALT